MKTTPRGIPYLEDTDPMDQVPVIIQALAETVDQLLNAKQNGEG